MDQKQEATNITYITLDEYRQGIQSMTPNDQAIMQFLKDFSELVPPSSQGGDVSTFSSEKVEPATIHASASASASDLQKSPRHGFASLYDA